MVPRDIVPESIVRVATTILQVLLAAAYDADTIEGPILYCIVRKHIHLSLIPINLSPKQKCGLTALRGGMVNRTKNSC